MDHENTTPATPASPITRNELHNKIDRLGQAAHTGVDKAAERIDKVSDQIGNKSEDLREAYKKFATSGRNYVRNSPTTAVLVALAAGFAVSKLIGSRKPH